MTTHAIVALHISSPESLAAYRDKAADALAKHGGGVLQASRELELIEGEADLPDIYAILTFPDRDAGLAWINDQALQYVHELRRVCGRTEITLI